MAYFVILNLVTFFDLILILLIGFYAFRFFIRYFGPKVVEKAADRIYRDIKAQEESRRGSENSSHGQVTVDRNGRKEKIFRRNDGEYIDFEEVKK